MKVVICHVQEYKKFDSSGLDIKDYLEANPESKFNQYNTKEKVVESLRGLSMRLIVATLPRSERGSAVVFGMVREILATSVLLPVMEKVTAPVWLNDQLLFRLKREVVDEVIIFD